MRYIIFWTLITLVPTVCPDYGRKDDLGRVINPGISCAVMHFRTEKESLSKVFYNRDSASAFYKVVINESKKEQFFQQNSIELIRIDSL